MMQADAAPAALTVQGYTPRADQREVLVHPARFKVMDCGRRWGKTVTETNWLSEGAINEGGENWFISPIFAQSKKVFREKLAAAQAGGAAVAFKDVSISELRIAYRNGGVEHYKSADNFEALRGSGLNRAVLDEAARMAAAVWKEVIRPAVSDTMGKVLFGSTPKGKNWFYEVFTLGQDPLQKEFKSWRLPSSKNPMMAAHEVEAARSLLPADIFAQEYMADFLDNAAAVFRNVKACQTATLAAPIPGQAYFAGLDLARLTDFTVLIILDAAGRMVFMDRFNLLDWNIQKARVVAAVQKYGAFLLVDSTGVGDPIYEDLRRSGIAVEGYKFTNESKGQLIEALMLAFEQSRIAIIDDQVLSNELSIYECQINRSGTVSYNAPDGYHDDTVIALALANWRLHHSLSPFAWVLKPKRTGEN